MSTVTGEQIGMVQRARARKYTVDRPFAGDVVCFDWEPNGWRDHIGFVEKVLALPRVGRPRYWVRTIEGTTSSRDQSNGGEVQRRRPNDMPSEALRDWPGRPHRLAVGAERRVVPVAEQRLQPVLGEEDSDLAVVLLGPIDRRSEGIGLA
jgi:hypothetical protein